MSVRLYVGNLPKELDRKDLQAVFAEEGESISAKVITDRKTGKCRGFGFVTVQSDDQADQIVEKYNGVMFGENALKIERAQPRKKSKGESEEENRSVAPVGKSSSSGGGKNRKKSNRSAGSSSSPSGDSGSIQPDPRWASDLEKLKQMLSAQTSNS
ncbi:RNA-binding protein [Lyngbya sp. CCY1209]|jgi:RNA recognition motif-containing protein|uniref:RNA recognition motif domain-containing protein n=1 Tax=Lyngbya sp. CCY1209 TaxID=2886103 RepID=UPI002D210EE0|nr:RNA-binding protein [Lyngbya sp. CCY1209]MEB3887409.1 RNA-binding protein [Lyngbya sp. CCY1209]